MRLIAFLLLGLSMLGGFTVSGGYFEVALINAVVFLVLALVAIAVIKGRFGSTGTVYAMAAAFMISLLWPIAVMPWLVEESPDVAAQGPFDQVECPPEGCRMIAYPPEPEPYFEDNP